MQGAEGTGPSRPPVGSDPLFWLIAISAAVAGLSYAVLSGREPGAPDDVINWLFAGGLGGVIVGGVLWVRRNQAANNVALGATDRSQVQRVAGLTYLGGHPSFPSPQPSCTLVFGPHDVAVERGPNLLWRMPRSNVSAVHVETEQEARQRITATRLALAGPFALAIPKKQPGSVLINVDTALGPMAFERLRSSKVVVSQELAHQIARFRAEAQVPSRSPLGSPAPLPPPPPPVVPPMPQTAAPPPPVGTSVHGGVADELAKLHDLHKSGVLTAAEFEAQKRRLLG